MWCQNLGRKEKTYQQTLRCKWFIHIHRLPGRDKKNMIEVSQTTSRNIHKPKFLLFTCIHSSSVNQHYFLTQYRLMTPHRVSRLDLDTRWLPAKKLSFRKCVSKCRLQDVGYFVPAPIYKLIILLASKKMFYKWMVFNYNINCSACSMFKVHEHLKRHILYATYHFIIPFQWCHMCLKV